MIDGKWYCPYQHGKYKDEPCEFRGTELEDGVYMGEHQIDEYAMDSATDIISKTVFEWDNIMALPCNCDDAKKCPILKKYGRKLSAEEIAQRNREHQIACLQNYGCGYSFSVMGVDRKDATDEDVEAFRKYVLNAEQERKAKEYDDFVQKCAELTYSNFDKYVECLRETVSDKFADDVVRRRNEINFNN